MKNLALIVAAGGGARFGGEVPKQYHKIGSKTVLEMTVEAFQKHAEIDGVLVVISKEHKKLFDLDVPSCFGGKERQDSVRLGLEAAKKFKPQNVLIHDAARAYVSADLISRVIEGLSENDSAVPVVKASDSVRMKDKAVNRDEVYLVQTPQGFNFEKILKAHEKVKTLRTKFSDDAQVADVAGIKLHFVGGDEQNIKITTKADIKNQTRETRIGMGFDVHGFETGTSVTLCGVKIPHTHKLKGHSDADVGLHAITDAILGAIGEGDIGEHFPPTDKKWKGADSTVFLKHAASLVEGEINNIDVTIICEAPKITPHKAAMKKRIAEILEIDESRVSVKATTTEKLGFAGRGEGIAAQAVATVSI